jgi:prefoldin subunit 5
MKQFNLGMRKILGITAGIAIGVMLMVGMGAVPATPAYAAAPTLQAEEGLRLEYILQRQQLWLTGQQNRLDQARQYVTITQPFLAELKAQGKDTSTLETALTNFSTQIQAAQVSHDAAKQILEAKAGFDANGQVTDPQQARETLRTARQSMMEAQLTMKQAVMDLRQIIREFRQANRENKPGETE